MKLFKIDDDEFTIYRINMHYIDYDSIRSIGVFSGSVLIGLDGRLIFSCIFFPLILFLFKLLLNA